MSGSQPKHHCHDTGSGTPEMLTRAGVSTGAPVTVVPDGFKDRPEEFFGWQGPGHLGSRLLKDIRKLRGVEKMKEEEQIRIKAHQTPISIGV